MNLAAMPYTTFLFLLEFAAGCMAVLLVAQIRGEVAKGFLKMGAILVPLTALPALWVASGFGGVAEVADYPLAESWLMPSRIALSVFSLLSIVYNWFIWREQS